MSVVVSQPKNGKLRPAERGRFLKALKEGNTVLDAADAAGRSARTFYRHREADQAFADAWAEAEKLSTQGLEKEARRRALDGSDNLLMFLLKKRDPSYRERASVEISGSIQHQHEHKVVSASAVLHVLEQAGAGSVRALADAEDVLPAPSNGQAGRVPPALAP